MESAPAAKTGEFFYGWDLLYKTIQGEVVKKSDLLIALGHFLLTKHYNFRCVGIGDDKTLPEEEGSELLPDNWNDDDTKYSLRYVHDKTLYLLLGHITEDALLINLMDINTKKVSNICVEPETLVAAVKGGITTLIPSASEIVERYRRELLDPVFTGNSREVTTQTTTSPRPNLSDPDPLRIGEPRRGGSFIPGGFEPRPFGFPDIGRGDLDPLGRGGSGNLFAFPSRPNMGPGPLPRFDPFSPLNPNGPGQGGINPDHMRPPNWGPDYYM
ncbi:hypothetical protein KR084_008965 [Drosophila pseudotakahashii]|nr:hypothetical protein KR084_008965 [Drosophila pseudotakahashii]